MREWGREVVEEVYETASDQNPNLPTVPFLPDGDIPSGTALEHSARVHVPRKYSNNTQA